MTEDSKTGSERRKYRRDSLRDRALAKRLDTGETDSTMVLNISMGGAFLEQAFPQWPVGTQIELQMMSWPEDLPLFGEIVHATGPSAGIQGLGVRWLELSLEQESILSSRAWWKGAKKKGAGPFKVEDILASQHTDEVAFCSNYPHAFLVRVSSRELGDSDSWPRLDLDRTVYCLRNHAELSTWYSVSIGRSKRCDVRIKSKRISRVHGAFERDPASGGYYLVDRGSRYGTRVNQSKLSNGERRLIQSGAVVDFAGVRFAFLGPRDMFSALRESGLIPRSFS